jgi:hypothetical protein
MISSIYRSADVSSYRYNYSVWSASHVVFFVMYDRPELTGLACVRESARLMRVGRKCICSFWIFLSGLGRLLEQFFCYGLWPLSVADISGQAVYMRISLRAV